MQNIEQHVADLERIFEALAGTIKGNNIGRGVRRKLMKAQQAVDRASGVLASLVEDEAPEKPAKEKAKKAPAKAKAAHFATAHVKRGKRSKSRTLAG